MFKIFRIVVGESNDNTQREWQRSKSHLDKCGSKTMITDYVIPGERTQIRTKAT